MPGAEHRAGGLSCGRMDGAVMIARMGWVAAEANVKGEGGTEDGLAHPTEDEGGESKGQREQRGACTEGGERGRGEFGWGGVVDVGVGISAVRLRAKLASAKACRCRKAMSVADVTLRSGGTSTPLLSGKKTYTWPLEPRLTLAK